MTRLNHRRGWLRVYIVATGLWIAAVAAGVALPITGYQWPPSELSLLESMPPWSGVSVPAGWTVYHCDASIANPTWQMHVCLKNARASAFVQALGVLILPPVVLSLLISLGLWTARGFRPDNKVGRD